MTVDLAELRALWEAASPAPWVQQGEAVPPYDRIILGGTKTVLVDGGRFKHRADAALIVAMHAALPQLIEACEKALWALEIAKYRLDGCMAYPGEPNSITEATTLLKSLGFGVPGSLVEPTPEEDP